MWWSSYNASYNTSFNSGSASWLFPCLRAPPVPTSSRNLMVWTRNTLWSSRATSSKPPLNHSVNDLILFSILSKPIKSIRSTVYSSPIRLLSFLWPTISNLDASSGSGSPGKVGGGSILPLYPISLGQKLGTLSFFMYKIPVSPRNHLCLPPL